MKESRRMVCRVDDETWPLGLLRRKMEEHVQVRLDEGWTLRSAIAPVCDTGRVWMIFVRKEIRKSDTQVLSRFR